MEDNVMWIDNVSDLDLLNYRPYLEILLDLVEDKNLSNCCVGLFGNWGIGKSTLINFLENEIVNKENIEIININAWLLEDFTNTKTLLLKMVLEDLEKLISKYKVSKVKFKKLKNSVNYFNVSTDVLPELISFMLGNMSNNLLSMNILQKLKNKLINKDYTIDQDKLKSKYLKMESVNEIRDFKKNLEDLLKESKLKKIVIVLDDLDRCSPDKILEILDVTKLFLSIEKIIFIIAIDERIIRDAINRKFPSDSLRSYNDYINKMVQIPLKLREPTEKEISLYIYKLVLQLHLDESDFNIIINHSSFPRISKYKSLIQENCIKTDILKKEFHFEDVLVQEIEVINTIRDEVATCLRGSPRSAKIFLNTFYIRKSLLKLYSIDDVDLSLLAKLMLLEIMNEGCYKDLSNWAYNGDLKLYKQFFDFSEENDLKNKNEYGLFDESIEWPKKFDNWRDIRIINWLYIKPRDLWNKKLKDYFFLTNTYNDNVKKGDLYLICKECKSEFVFTSEEQAFYVNVGFKNKPLYCPDCRKKLREARKQARKFNNKCEEDDDWL